MLRRLFALTLLLLAPTLAWAALGEGEFRDRTLGVRLTLLEGWSATTQTGYPSLLLVMAAPTREATISLSAGWLAHGVSIADHVGDSLKGLRAVGLQVISSTRTSIAGRPIWEVVARGRGDVELRQVYLVQGSRVFILSLAGARAVATRYVQDLQQAALLLAIE